MNQLMQEMTPDQNESIRATHIGNPDICLTAIPEVRAQDSRPIWRTDANVF
jgi:hypothetical protein